ncbi:MAG: pirin family protein [Bacteroidia bacterium]|nr:pirin family protein [Bacteroidia bacterium]
MSNITLHKANTRGEANHGWLNAKHTFSFAGYQNRERMNFGVIRVLNDDCIAGGMGFGMHPHDNMEIITIPLEGEIEHRDNMGNIGRIKRGDIQVMSAGTGVEHSEYNASKTDDLKLLQIWLFPNKQNVTPRYAQLTLNADDNVNKFQQILSPNPDDEGLWIHQDAWFSLGKLDTNLSINYDLKKEGNGMYIFVISGSVTVLTNVLETRDGIGLWNEPNVIVTANSAAEVLIMDVPNYK